MDKKNLIILIAIISIKGYGQSFEDVFSFNYTLAPTGNDAVDFYKTDVKLSLPVKLKKGMLVHSLGLDYYQLNYQDSNLNTTDLDEFYHLGYSLTYVYPLSKKWSLSVRGSLSINSNLTNTISSDDLLINGGLMAIKRGGTIEKPSMIMFGLGYATLIGKPTILPIISYTKRLSNKFSYGLGFPNTYAKYTLNMKSYLKAGLWFNGFYTNLSKAVGVDMVTQANKAAYNSGSLSIEYNFKMDNFWAISVKGGYSLFNSYQLLDDTNNNVYEFNTNNQPYFSTGVKFNL